MTPLVLSSQIARAAKHAQSLGIINMLDAARCSHLQRAKIDWPRLRPCATTWAIMRQHEPLITDCAQVTVYFPINPLSQRNLSAALVTFKDYWLMQIDVHRHMVTA